MIWREATWLAVDTETTSPLPEEARIVTACVGTASPAGWSARCWLLRQADPIPAEATAIHGITTEKANADGADPAVALPEIVAAIRDGWANGGVVVGQNIGYDLTVLDRELRRHGLPPITIDGPIVDTLVIDRALDRYRKGSRKLADMATHYGVELGENAHGAEADAQAAARIAWKLGPQLPEDPDQLMSWQQRQYAQQRLGLALHFLDTADDGLDTAMSIASRLHWPLTPYQPERVAA